MSAREVCSWCDAPAAVALGTTQAACDAHKLENHPPTRAPMGPTTNGRTTIIPNYTNDSGIVTAALESGCMQIVNVSW